MKLFFLTAQLQALRLVDSVPWAFLLFGKFKKSFTLYDFLITFIYSFYIFLGLAISSDLLLKTISHLLN